MRKQGAVNVEIDVTGTDIVVDNAGSVLKGPELLFASEDSIRVESRQRAARPPARSAAARAICACCRRSSAPWISASTGIPTTTW